MIKRLLILLMVLMLPVGVAWGEELGAELLTDPGLTNWDGSDDLVDWTENNEDANNYITEHANGARMVSNDTVILDFDQTITTVTDQLYKLTVEISNYVSGDVRLYTDVMVGNMGWTANGTYYHYFIASDATTIVRFYRWNDGNTDLVYSNISLKPVLNFQSLTGIGGTESLGAELITGLTNNVGAPFDTFTSPDAQTISSAISDGVGDSICYSNSINLLNKLAKVTFDFVLNSGSNPDFRLAGGTSLIPTATFINQTLSGTDSYEFYALVVGDSSVYGGFRIDSAATNFSVSNFSITPLTSLAGAGISMGGTPDVGAEAITAQNDRDFSGGTIGNWTAQASGAGNIAYDSTDLDFSNEPGDNKQALLTSSSDTYLWGQLTPQTFTANTIHKFSAKVAVPAGNTLKDVALVVSNIGALQSSPVVTLADNTWTEIVAYIHITSDIYGTLRISFNGDPADGDKLYFDDISIKPVTAMQ